VPNVAASVATREPFVDTPVLRCCSVSPRHVSVWNRVDIIPQIVSFYYYYRHISGYLSVAGNQLSLFYHRIPAAAVVVVVYENCLMVP